MAFPHTVPSDRYYSDQRFSSHNLMQLVLELVLELVLVAELHTRNERAGAECVCVYVCIP